MGPPCPRGISRFGPAKKLCFWPHNKSFIVLLLLLFFCGRFLDFDFVSVHWNTQKRTLAIFSHLDLIGWVERKDSFTPKFSLQKTTHVVSNSIQGAAFLFAKALAHFYKTNGGLTPNLFSLWKWLYSGSTLVSYLQILIADCHYNESNRNKSIDNAGDIPLCLCHQRYLYCKLLPWFLHSALRRWEWNHRC